MPLSGGHGVPFRDAPRYLGAATSLRDRKPQFSAPATPEISASVTAA
jgi:hypothetical protein